MIRRRFRYAATFVALAATVFATAGFSRAQTSSAGHAATAPAAATVGYEWNKRPNPYQYLPKVPTFRLTSQTVKNGKPLPIEQFSGIVGVPGGKDISPQLSWSGFPKGTKSFVVSMFDPEASTMSGFWHWVVADLPATTKSLPADAGTLNSTTLPAGAFQLTDDAGAPRFLGAAPPPRSGLHDYYLTVTALDVPVTGGTATTSPALLTFLIGSHTLARATIICPTPSS